MDWKEFFERSVEDLFDDRPLTQLIMKDGTVIQGRLIGVDPFIVVESDMHPFHSKPTGRIQITGREEISSVRLIVPHLLPKTWDGFDEA